MKGFITKVWAFVLVSILGVGSFSLAGMLADEEEFPSTSIGSGPAPFGTGTTPRTVLAELFTNWDCGPCRYANPPLNRLGDEYTSDQLALLYFHMWWPGSDDPFYLANIPVMTERRNYYGIPWVPKLKLDGSIDIDHNGDLTYDLYQSNIESELLEDTNLKIDLTANITSTEGFFTAKITATDPVTETNLFVRAYVWEDDKWAAGTNGEVRHRHVVRDSVLESPLMISEGQTVSFQNTFPVDPSWDKRRLGIAVFVQSDANQRVLQAATHDFVPQGILLVHDSQDMSMEEPFDETLTYNQISYERHNIQDLGDSSLIDIKDTPTAVKMAKYGAVLWHTSSVSFDTLNPTDESRLQTYLDSYGNLFLTGENIGSELNNDPFFTNYLHGIFVSDTLDSQIQGVLGDPISWKWPPPDVLSITGASPEIVSPADASTWVSFHYYPSGFNGGLRALHDTDSRVVYFPFMYFEGTGRFDSDRDIMLKSIINWLDNASAPVVGVTAPTGGERVLPLTNYDIKWNARDVSIPGDGVRLEYTLDWTSPLWISIAANEPNDGIFTWSVPSESTSKAKVRVCVVDSMGQESCNETDPFTIGTPNVPPEPPLLTGAYLSGSSYQDVTLVWDKSPDDGGGFNDVLEYDIYSSTTLGGPTTYLGSEPATGAATYTWACTGCGDGDPSQYFFYVWADDGEDQTASPAVAGKFTRALSAGWRLVSVPLIQMDTSADVVLQTIDSGRAVYYNVIDQADHWKNYDTIRNINDLGRIDHAMGFWLYTRGQDDFTVAGIVPESTDIILQRGWNMVGFPSFSTTYTIQDMMSVTSVTKAEAFEATASPHLLRRITTVGSDLMNAGEGYWVYATSTSLWIVL